MRPRRVFLKPLAAGEVRLSGAEAHHLGTVLRVRPGAEILAFDGLGREAAGKVLAVDEACVRLELGEPEASAVEAPCRLTLAVGLLKGDKMADVVRMGTELGVAAFVPLQSARADVTSVSAGKLERWRRVAREAAKQSGRSVVPEVAEPLPASGLEPGGLGLVAHPEAGASLRDVLAGASLEGAHLTLATGPEGGWGKVDLEALGAKGFVPVRLGPRILRAETAPVALAAAILVPEGL